MFKVGDEVEYCEGYRWCVSDPADKVIWTGRIESETPTQWRVLTKYGSKANFYKHNSEETRRGNGSRRYIRKAVTK